MLEQGEPVQSEVLKSLLNWWSEMGVEALADEVPQPWLGRAEDVMAAGKTAKGKSDGQISRSAALSKQPAAPRPAPLPSDYAGFIDWLKEPTNLPFAGPASQRLPASATPCDLMVMIEMPDHDDLSAGQLISGEAGILFEKMLSAMNRTREMVYIASFCPGRTPSGRLHPEEFDILTPIALHHIAIARPKGVWIMSQGVSRALLGADAAPGLGSLRQINHEGRTVEAVASYSPRFLLQQPKRKGAAWADMQALMRGIDE